MNIKNEKGSVSLEAAIAIPVFFCVVIAVVFLLRCVQVYERMSHAITQSALQVSGMAYPYAKLGLLDVSREAEAVIGRGADRAVSTVKKSVQFENWLPDDIAGDVNEQLDRADDALTDAANSAVFFSMAKLVTKGYLDGQPNTNIVGGEDGISYFGSTFLSDESEDVRIKAAYEFSIPIFIKSLSSIKISQSAYARAWLYGAGSNDAPNEGEVSGEPEEDIWSLGNFERGKKLREIYHANLPESFPGISAYKGGVATLIKSLDTTAKSYQTPAGIKSKILGYVREIRDYKGQTKPFGKEGITIPPDDISVRRLTLVLPRNDMPPEVKDTIDLCIREALSDGVVLDVEYYGKKAVENPEDSK